MPPADDYVDPPNKVALVIGGNGVTGSYIVEYLLSLPSASWARVIAISRKPPFAPWLREMRDIAGSGVAEADVEAVAKAGGTTGRLSWVCSDLLEDSHEVVEEKLKAVGGDGITHVFYAGYVVVDGWMGPKERAANAKLFDVGVGAAAKVAAKAMRRIVLQVGAKWYGFHTKYTVCPLTEEDEPDPKGADFYLDQWASAKRLSEASGGQFDWTVTIPTGIYGFARSSYMNSATTFALYAAVQAFRGEPLEFPGSKERWIVGNDFIDSMLLAKFDVWAGTTGKCGGECFNVSNGSVFTHEWLWPWLCKQFGCKMPDLDPTTHAPTKSVSVQELMTGRVLPTPASSTTLDADLAKVVPVDSKENFAERAWREMCEKYPGMDPEAIKWATWWFIEFGQTPGVYKMILLNSDKGRRFGFKEYTDPRASFADTFERMKRAGALPPFVGTGKGPQ
ncbi:hypothetical protein DFJ74DRAFT_658633 [Hyaloraphidium curvatum]|nr:hypothetical protein DFJ74DRAFT_658633 [Hyaloraphidium curvatum]